MVAVWFAVSARKWHDIVPLTFLSMRQPNYKWFIGWVAARIFPFISENSIGLDFIVMLFHHLHHQWN